MKAAPVPSLSRRERQIMDVIYRLGRATAADVAAALPDAPTYTTVRGLLRILERKGHLHHVQEGQRYVYLPLAPRESAGASLLSHVVRTFFDGSTASAVAALLGRTKRLSDAELRRLSALIDEARVKRGAR
jgi:predicted transcriptional regulator